MYIPDYDLEGDEQTGYNIRVPPKMKEEIERRYKASNLSMAKWTRRALLFALQNMDDKDVFVLRREELKGLIEEVLTEKGIIKNP